MTVILYVYGIYCNIGNNLVTIHCMWLHNSVMYHYTFPPIKNVIVNAPRARVSPKYRIAVVVRWQWRQRYIMNMNWMMMISYGSEFIDIDQ